MTSALKVHVIHSLAVQDAWGFPRLISPWQLLVHHNRLTCYVITTIENFGIFDIGPELSVLLWSIGISDYGHFYQDPTIIFQSFNLLIIKKRLREFWNDLKLKDCKDMMVAKNFGLYVRLYGTRTIFRTNWCFLQD